MGITDGNHLGVCKRRRSSKSYGKICRFISEEDGTLQDEKVLHLISTHSKVERISAIPRTIRRIQLQEALRPHQQYGLLSQLHGFTPEGTEAEK